MKKIIQGVCWTFLGVTLQTAAHAAPIDYRFDTFIKWSEYLIQPDGASIQLNDSNFVFPRSELLSISFTYNASAVLSSYEMPEDTADYTYGPGFQTDSAVTNVTGTLGGQQFFADALHSKLFSVAIHSPGVYPYTDNVLNGLGGDFFTEGVFGSGFQPFSFSYSGQNFVLTNFRMGFPSTRADGVLPDSLFGGGGFPSAELYFTSDDGYGLDLLYIGELTPVPVPGALWLFGSALLPMALRIFSSKKK